MSLPSLENLQKRPGRSYYIRVLIEDNGTSSRNPEWVDFSDRIKDKKDRILNIPNIKINTDSRFIGSKYTTSSGSLSVDNSDRFWDKPVSLTFKTEKGNTAIFSTSKNSSETVWSRHRIQFRLVEFFRDQYREKTIGTFLIDDIITDLTEKASIKIVGLERPLQERDARSEEHTSELQSH